jgi:hypothetical protein
MRKELFEPGTWIAWTMILLLMRGLVRVWPNQRYPRLRFAVKFFADVWVTMTIVGLAAVGLEHFGDVLVTR